MSEAEVEVQNGQAGQLDPAEVRRRSGHRPFASGGVIKGPGSQTDDSVPIMIDNSAYNDALNDRFYWHKVLTDPISSAFHKAIIAALIGIGAVDYCDDCQRNHADEIATAVGQALLPLRESERQDVRAKIAASLRRDHYGDQPRTEFEAGYRAAWADAAAQVEHG